jgi:hypothetical protein
MFVIDAIKTKIRAYKFRNAIIGRKKLCPFCKSKLKRSYRHIDFGPSNFHCPGIMANCYRHFAYRHFDYWGDTPTVLFNTADSSWTYVKVTPNKILVHCHNGNEDELYPRLSIDNDNWDIDYIQNKVKKLLAFG